MSILDHGWLETSVLFNILSLSLPFDSTDPVTKYVTGILIKGLPLLRDQVCRGDTALRLIFDSRLVGDHRSSFNVFACVYAARTSHILDHGWLVTAVLSNIHSTLERCNNISDFPIPGVHVHYFLSGRDMVATHILDIILS